MLTTGNLFRGDIVLLLTCYFLIIIYSEIVHYEDLRLHNATENINLFMVEVDKKKENIWLYTFYIISLLVFDLLTIDLMIDCLTALIYQQWYRIFLLYCIVNRLFVLCRLSLDWYLLVLVILDLLIIN